jgi:hypothetical protein
MATLTITLDPELLEAAQREAELSQTTVEELVIDFLRTIARPRPTNEEIERMIELMKQGPLGTIDRPLTREEIYAERTWPRS